MARDFLGTDTRFPIAGKFQKVAGVETVLQDLQLLISTVPGERVNRPEYGCRLYTRLWDNIDAVAREGLTDIREAVRLYEPRVELISLSAQLARDTGTVTFTIKFRIVGTNNAANLVFPFQPSLNNA
jgi:phage baseplate assembly protein W